ncbi:MAG: hypothetical protein J7L89_07005 [Bacteroidales bacterium]|nr:hypothetical protein [Bacteroidales bacterium]RKX88003.1 MAG: hypothetical protein DRP70_07370 [Spirochaetota bacterium]RKX95057.1 MAG: hypothetical protein DRZ90_10870 [Spirochaetota bacterium]
MAKIDDISFAKLVSGGKVCRTTCLVFRDKIDSRWWRKTGTVYSPDDFKEVISTNPETVILGIGLLNKLTVAPETLTLFEREGIKCEVMDSQPAVDRFNALYDSGKSVVGAFHLM